MNVLIAFPSRNSFEVFLASQQELSQPKLPFFVKERNNKDRLYNSVLRLLDRKELRRRSDTASTHSTRFVRTLTNVLWYIDGHHDILKSTHSPSQTFFKILRGTIYQNNPSTGNGERKILSNPN